MNKILLILGMIASVICSLIISFFIGKQNEITTTPDSVLANTSNTYLVTKVVDGDTVYLNKNNQRFKVRLVGIDTPETVDPRKQVECYGLEAKQYLSDLILDKNVEFETDPSQDTYDKYGRLLGYIYLDSQLINLKMIEGGYAYEYTYETPYEFQLEFKLAQQNAQTNKLGLWNEANCGSVN